MSHFYDVIIAGGGFAGLICAKTLAERGVKVAVLERKNAAGVGMHTTGIIVKECADEFHIPEAITHKVTNVHLYAPNLKQQELISNNYFFLTTDTPALMRFFSDAAIQAGATIHYDTAYDSARAAGNEIIINDGAYRCSFLIGADGPRSKVAQDFNLGKNTEFLLGAEAEYKNLPLSDTNAFYCFLNQTIAHGYIGWVIPSVGVTQVGVAQRLPAKPDVNALVERVKPLFDFSESEIVARRGGLIPCGGLVRPFANDRVILLGDAAGIVSPLTAGGIHTALRYGNKLGAVLADYLKHGGAHPAIVLEKIYPRFYFKQLLRKTFELTPNAFLNLAIDNPLFSLAARTVFYKKKKLK